MYGAAMRALKYRGGVIVNPQSISAVLTGRKSCVVNAHLPVTENAQFKNEIAFWR